MPRNQMLKPYDRRFCKSFLTDTAEIFEPLTLPLAVCGAGLGVLKIASPFFRTQNEGIYLFLSVIFGAVFELMNIPVSVSAAEKFRFPPTAAALIGAVLGHFSASGNASDGTVLEYIGIFGIQIERTGYLYSPAVSVLAVFIASRVYARGEPSKIPKAFSLYLSAAIGFLSVFFIIGPALRFVSSALLYIFIFLYSRVTITDGAYIGAFYSFFSFFGVEGWLKDAESATMALSGGNEVLPIVNSVLSALGGISFGVFLKKGGKGQKAEIMFSSLASLLGYPQAAIFGIIIKDKSGIIAASVAGGIAGTVMKILQTAEKRAMYINISLYISGIIIAFIIGCVVYLWIHKKRSPVKT